MADLTTGLHFIAYQGQTVTLADTSYKANIKSVYAINQTSNGFIAFKPSSSYPALKILESGHLYLVDILTQFTLPNSVELAFPYTIQEADGIDIKQDLSGNGVTSVPSVKAVKEAIEVVDNKLLNFTSDDLNTEHQEYAGLSIRQALLNLINNGLVGTGDSPNQLDAVTNLQLTVSNNQIDVSWNSVPNATSYVVQRAEDISFTSNVVTVHSGPATSFSDTSGLIVFTEFFYRIKALAPGFSDSQYVVNSIMFSSKGNGPGYDEGIARLNITVDDLASISKEEKTPAQFEFLNSYGSSYSAPQLYVGSGNIKLAGNFTAQAPKKPYNLSLPSVFPVLGLNSTKDYRLLAEYYDPTLERNSVVSYLSQQMGLVATTKMRPVEVYVNGDYHGYYTLSERVKQGSGVTVDVLTVSPEDQELPQVSGGYLVEKVIDIQENFLEKTSFKTPLYGDNYVGPIYVGEPHSFNIEYPDFGDITTNQIDYIQNYILAAENSLDNNWTDLINGPQAYFDVTSLICYYLVQEFSKNIDGESHSSFFYKPRGSKLIAGPLWDFDQAFPQYEGTPDDSPDGYWTRRTPWFQKLFNDEAFTTAVNTVFKSLRPTLLKAITFAENRTKLLLDTGAAQRNNSKWDIYNSEQSIVTGGRTIPPTYQGHSGLLLSFMRKRFEWLDLQMGSNYGNERVLRFDSQGYVQMPQLSGIRTIRLWFRDINTYNAVRAAHLLDLTTQEDSYSVSLNGSYSGFGGITSRFTGYKNGSLITQKNDAKPNGSYDFNSFLDGFWNRITLVTEEAVTSMPTLLSRFQNNNQVYFYGCELGTVEFYSRELTDMERNSPQTATGGLLALYRGQKSQDGTQLLDESGNGQHATFIGSTPTSLT